jgi:hypothetical protein
MWVGEGCWAVAHPSIVAATGGQVDSGSLGRVAYQLSSVIEGKSPFVNTA